MRTMRREMTRWVAGLLLFGAAGADLADWKSVKLEHLLSFLQHERDRSVIVRVPSSASSIRTRALSWRLLKR